MSAIDNVACPRPGCDDFQKAGANIVRHGGFTTKLGRRRRYRCTSCGGTFSTNTGTAYAGLRCTRNEFDLVASLRVEGEHFCDSPGHGTLSQHDRQVA